MPINIYFVTYKNVVPFLFFEFYLLIFMPFMLYDEANKGEYFFETESYCCQPAQENKTKKSM